MKISEKLDEFLKLCDDGMNCDFSIPYRRAIAEKLFKRCGKGFICYVFGR